MAKGRLTEGGVIEWYRDRLASNVTETWYNDSNWP